MAYNHEGQNQGIAVFNLLPYNLTEAIVSQDVEQAALSIEMLAEQDSVASVWGEALGTRLQIRDFLSFQKGEVALLAETENYDLNYVVSAHMQQMEHDISIITGKDAEGNQYIPSDALKINRIYRLVQEVKRRDKQSTFRLLTGFSNEITSNLRTSEELNDILMEHCFDIVDILYGVAQTYREGFAEAAIRKLQTGTVDVTKLLDRHIAKLLVPVPTIS